MITLYLYGYILHTVYNILCSAEKQWGDIVGIYYMPQWQLFVDLVIECMKNGSTWNEKAFTNQNFQKYELPFSYAIGGYHIEPVNDTIIVACNLYKKWYLNGDVTCA